ncbi:SDR family NAD(P)-dependent oxidoreductase [Variovorax sp. LT1R16]|uniref:SDR family NAD(P)-dependent oxidoreductase n=1 Tax=Variovorax sp. LT1R16 TaxID=3443728 RepID=UPI003F44CA9B
MNDQVDFLSLTRLDGRGCVVLGAGQGIGEQVTHALAQAGARVLCVDRDEQLARNIADAVDGVPCAADVTSRPDMERVFATARKEFGRVHAVVDIIGVSGIRPLAAFTDEAWTQQFDIVLRHAFLSIQIAGEMMAADGGGSITVVGSMGGDRAVPNQTAYGSAKAALHHLVRCAGVEYASRGVRINAVAPGYVRTPRLNQRLDDEAWTAIAKVIPIGRAATPAEIAATLLFLSCDLSSHMTGVVMPVDGGASAMGAFPDVKFKPANTP